MYNFIAFDNEKLSLCVSMHTLFIVILQICKNLQQSWSTVWVDDIKAPYAYQDNQWVGYDDVTSIGYKVSLIRIPRY